jgi:hypothetical protein
VVPGRAAKGCLACHPAGVAAGYDQLRRAYSSVAAFVQEVRCDVADEDGQVVIDVGDLLRQPLDATSDAAHHI